MGVEYHLRGTRLLPPWAPLRGFYPVRFEEGEKPEGLACAFAKKGTGGEGPGVKRQRVRQADTWTGYTEDVLS